MPSTHVAPFAARWRYSHNNPRMVFHDGVVQVESSEVHERRSLQR